MEGHAEREGLAEKECPWHRFTPSKQGVDRERRGREHANRYDYDDANESKLARCEDGMFS